MSYVVVTSHRGMALDAGRNEAYARALAAAITPDSVVLDLGAGTGVHGLMAARLGARRVYLVEPEDIIALAEENVRANGLQDVVRCIQGRVEDVTLPEPVDVIVSALTGNFLLTEDLLPVLFHARDRFLRPGGHLIPGAATMEVMPVTAEALHEREIASWSRPQQGVDLGAARPYAANTLFYRTEGFEALTELADPSWSTRSISTRASTSHSTARLKASSRVRGSATVGSGGSLRSSATPGSQRRRARRGRTGRWRSCLWIRRWPSSRASPSASSSRVRRTAIGSGRPGRRPERSGIRRWRRRQ